MRLPKTFATIIAEEPYDDMGREFQEVFGAWVDQTSARKDGDTPQHFQLLAFGLFQRRLALAQKYHTFFATQMVSGTRELWRERYTGSLNDHYYSFAIRKLARTARFFAWCESISEPANDGRVWDVSIKPLPSLPLEPHQTFPVMPVWARLHQPQFRARRDGPFFLRRIHLGPEVHLIEHPDNHWVPNIRQEAQEYWFQANDPANPAEARATALAAFEWIWFWTNPFGRAGALTGDALSLITQKQMVGDGLAVHIRPGYYHQDCEALLLCWEEYLVKRATDLLHGFTPRFRM
jgi:hypothetical protein